MAPVAALPVLFGVSGLVYGVAAAVLTGIFIKHAWSVYRLRDGKAAERAPKQCCSAIRSSICLPCSVRCWLIARHISCGSSCRTRRDKMQEIETYTPTTEEAERRRKRSLALALILVALVAIVFVTTIVRLGGDKLPGVS
jgi:hypothetical protein